MASVSQASPALTSPIPVKLEPKAEPKDWEAPPPSQVIPPTAVVVATPHTTQHPLDYIQEQLNQASLQVHKFSINLFSCRSYILLNSYRMMVDMYICKNRKVCIVFW